MRDSVQMIRAGMPVSTCIDMEHGGYKVIGQPRLHHEAIDKIIDSCRAQFGKDRGDMQKLLAKTEEVLSAYTEQQSVYAGQRNILRHLFVEVWRSIWELITQWKVSPRPMDSERDILCHIATYQTLRTLIRTAELEHFDPERLRAFSAAHPPAQETESLLLKRGF